MTNVNDSGDPIQDAMEPSEHVIVPLLGEQWSCWQPLVTTTSLYCLMIFFVGIAISLQGPAVSAFFIGISISFSMVQLTGIFAVLAPGSYLTRLAISQFCGGMFLLSLVGGVAVSGYEHSQGFFGSLWIVAVVGSASAQMIYGVFRLSRGWQIHLDIHERGPAYTVKDLFALTLFIAVLLSAVNLNASTTAPEESRVRLILSVFVFVSVGTLGFWSANVGNKSTGCRRRKWLQHPSDDPYGNPVHRAASRSLNWGTAGHCHASTVRRVRHFTLHVVATGISSRQGRRTKPKKGCHLAAISAAP